MPAKSNAAADPEVTVKDLSAQIEKLQRDLGELTETMGKLGASQRDAAVAELSGRLDRAKDEGARLAHDAANTARRLGDEAGRSVRDNPMAALAIAAAVGAVFGYLTSRR